MNIMFTNYTLKIALPSQSNNTCLNNEYLINNVLFNIK